MRRRAAERADRQRRREEALEARRRACLSEADLTLAHTLVVPRSFHERSVLARSLRNAGRSVEQVAAILGVGSTLAHYLLCADEQAYRDSNARSRLRARARRAGKL